MGGTVFALFGVCIAAALAELLLPESSKGTRSVLRLLSVLAVLVLLISPFLSFLGKENAFSFESLVGQSEEDATAAYEEIFMDAVTAQSEKELTEGLYSLLSSQYGIKREDARILCRFDDKGGLLRVEIYLSGAALLRDPYEIEQELAALLNCETEVR